MTDTIKQTRGNTRSGVVGDHEPHLTGDDWGYTWKAWRIYDAFIKEVRIYVEIYEDGEPLPDTEYRKYRHSTKTHDLHWVQGDSREDVVDYLRDERLTCKENYQQIDPLSVVQHRLRENLSDKVSRQYEDEGHGRWLAEKHHELTALYGHGYGGQLYRDRAFDMI